MADASRAGWFDSGGWRKAGRPALLLVAVGILALVSILAKERVFSPIVWPCNALIAFVLLHAERRRRAVYATAGLLGILGANLLGGNDLTSSILYSLLNGLEVLIFVSICGLYSDRENQFATTNGLLTFVAAAAVAPLVAGSLAGLSGMARHDLPFLYVLQIWYIAKAFGYLVVFPTLFGISERPIRSTIREFASPGGLALISGFLVVSAVTYASHGLPILYFMLLPLVLIALTMSQAASSSILILLYLITLASAQVAIGPFALVEAYDSAEARLGIAMWFLATASLVVLSISTVVAGRRKALAVARMAARAKSDFLANMNHELRTPMTSIIGYLELLLRRSDLTDEVRRILERIGSASETMRLIVNNVLDLSKLEAGKLGLSPGVAVPDDILVGAVAVLLPQADAKGISLRMETGSLPSLITIDSTRLTQILLNLLSNAVKFTNRGSVVLRASYDPSHQQLHVIVEDTGKGIRLGDQGALFQRFAQLASPDEAYAKGSGLGLAISKGLVEAMGGEIGFSSSVGEGSKFWFHVSAPLATRTGSQEDSQPTDLTDIRVLIVDDDPTSRKVAQTILMRSGAEVTVAEDGPTGVRAALARPFDLILTEIKMAGLDGYEVTRQIRDQPGPNRDIPILAVTADIGADTTGNRSPGLFDGRIPKPIVPDDLLQAVALRTNPFIEGAREFKISGDESPAEPAP